MIGRLSAVAAAVAGICMMAANLAQAQTRSFDVPSDAAVRSIPQFSRQAGLQIMAPADGLSSVVTPAIRGERDVRAALRELLVGTGLVIASDSGNVIVLQRAAPAARATAAGAASGATGLATATTSAAPAEQTAAPVIVTGSRLRQLDGDSATPVAVVPAEALVGRSSNTSVGDQLSVLPQFRATFTQAASTGIGLGAPGQVGLNLLDLRGMGTTRTLVLQNGRRLVSSSQSVAQPDTNTIPTALLRRVEVLTGGASAIYGADAIAGAVNFVLQDNFDGLSLRAQLGSSVENDAGTSSGSVTVGRNFSGGRGNVAASFETSRREGLRYFERPFSVGQAQFVPNPNAGQPGEPSQIQVQDLRLLSNSTGGTLPYGPPFYRFASNGTLNPANVGARALLNLGISEGGDGLSTVTFNSLLPSNERVSLNVLGRYEVGAATTAFAHVTAMTQRSKAFGNPVVSQLNLKKSNPHLDSQALGVLNGYGPTANAPSFVVIRASEDLGVLAEAADRETLRGLVGIKGALAPNWNYELSATYGRVGLRVSTLNNQYPDRVARAADAVVDTAGVLGTRGAIVCASRLAAGGAPTGNPAIDECVPGNFLGAGSVSANVRRYVTLDTQATGRIAQQLLTGFVSGDTSGWLALPGGPVSVVAGFEHRSDETRYTPDARDAGGLTASSGAGAVQGKVNVSEVFSEVKLPLLAKLPMVRKLELTGSLRASDYSLGGVGRTNSWGVGLLYQVNPQITLRSSTQNAVRAPNVAELFEPTAPTQVGINDPCSVQNLTLGSATRAANCTALGMPAGFRANTLGRPTAATSGGNPNLTVELGETRTIGLMLAPAFAPGFVMAIDYYRVDLKNAITKPNSNVILTTCVDSLSIDNPFCRFITRGTDFNVTRVAQQTMNLTRQLAEGVDLDARLSLRIAPDVRADLRAQYTHVIARNDYLRPTEPNFATQQVERPSDPRNSLTFATNVAVGSWQLSHKLRWFSGVWRADPANFESVNGLPPINPTLLPESLKRTPAASFHDLRVAYVFGKGRELYLGIDNLSNTKPPPGIYAAGFGGANYDAVGRSYYAGLRHDF
jgi:outer membrane receptor protein involved in Fe transport